jgi:hypothetical protein
MLRILEILRTGGLKNILGKPGGGSAGGRLGWAEMKVDGHGDGGGW